MNISITADMLYVSNISINKDSMRAIQDFRWSQHSQTLYTHKYIKSSQQSTFVDTYVIKKNILKRQENGIFWSVGLICSYNNDSMNQAQLKGVFEISQLMVQNS